MQVLDGPLQHRVAPGSDIRSGRKDGFVELDASTENRGAIGVGHAVLGEMSLKAAGHVNAPDGT